MRLLSPINPFTAWSIIYEKNQLIAQGGKHGTKESLIGCARKAFERRHHKGRVKRARTVLALATRVHFASKGEILLMKEVFNAIVDGCKQQEYAWESAHGQTYGQQE
jgi:hypothetical protein